MMQDAAGELLSQFAASNVDDASVEVGTSNDQDRDQPKRMIDMMISDEFDFDNANNLARQFEGVISQDNDLTHREALLGLMISIGNILASISCRDCRGIAAQYVNQHMREIVVRSLNRGGEEAAPDHPHIH
jgi:hypothetical protein